MKNAEAAVRQNMEISEGYGSSSYRFEQARVSFYKRGDRHKSSR
jgi:hypothetical protein